MNYTDTEKVSLAPLQKRMLSVSEKTRWIVKKKGAYGIPVEVQRKQV